MIVVQTPAQFAADVKAAAHVNVNKKLKLNMWLLIYLEVDKNGKS